MKFRVKYKVGAFYSYIKRWGFYRVIGENTPNGIDFDFTPIRSKSLVDAWEVCKECAEHREEEAKKQKTYASREF